MEAFLAGALTIALLALAGVLYWLIPFMKSTVDAVHGMGHQLTLTSELICKHDEDLRNIGLFLDKLESYRKKSNAQTQEGK